MVKQHGKAPLVEATVDDLAHGGEGIVHAVVSGERRAVFVRGTAPGDRVRVSVDLGSRPARGELLELLQPGPGRAEAPCADAGRCGGCDWMHLTPGAQREGHERAVRSILPREWAAVPLAYFAAPGGVAVRTRVRLHVRGSGGRAIVGLHEARSHEPIEVAHCLVLHPRLEGARARLGALFEGAHGTGDVSLALGGALDASPEERLPVLDVTFSRDLPARAYARFEEAVATGAFAGVRARAGGVTRPATVGDPRPWIVAGDGRPLRLPPGGFAQASEACNAVLVERVRALATEALGSRGPGGASSAAAGPIVELYAGAGNLSLVLAPLTDRLLTVESHEEACVAARENLAARNLTAKVVTGDAGQYAWTVAPSLLVLDPPRTGARDLAERIAAAAVREPGARKGSALPLPRAVLYVSCDPPTLGRDLASFARAGYAPKAVELVEMFPHTSHIETLVWLERSRGRG